MTTPEYPTLRGKLSATVDELVVKGVGEAF